MEKRDYIAFILENISIYGLNDIPEFHEDKIRPLLDALEESTLKIAAGFNKEILKHFLKKVSEGGAESLKSIIPKLEKLSQLTGPTGTLSYFTENQTRYVLSKLEQLSEEELTENKISLLGDEQLQKEFGGQTYSSYEALENQLASAEFYLKEMGYSEEEIKNKIDDIKKNPEKIDSIFCLPPKEIISLPPELQQREGGAEEKEMIDEKKKNEIISHHVESIQQEIGEQRRKQVEEILEKIKRIVKDRMSENQEKVFQQMHPDRLNRALKMLGDNKRNSRRLTLLLDWFTNSFLLSKIELKVEHWQVSSSARPGSTGVYTAGIEFSRYDNIIKDFSDSKLEKVVNISNKILLNPSKKALQKLGQDLIRATGFDEHLYFTD